MKVIYFLLAQTLLIGMQFGVFILAKNEVKELKIASLEKEYSYVEWDVNQSAIQKTETINENYYNNAKKDIYTFQHTGDDSLRITLHSAAMRLLLKEEYILVKEGNDGEHLALTVYFNPLKVKNPEQKDLIMTYQIVKYKKPNIILEIEKEAELLADKEADTSGIDKDKQLFEPKYPFDESQILEETEEHIIFVKDYVADEMLNVDFYRTYLEDGSVVGEYGVEIRAFSENSDESEVEK